MGKFAVVGVDSGELTSWDPGMIFAITNKSSTVPQYAGHPNATIALQMN